MTAPTQDSAPRVLLYGDAEGLLEAFRHGLQEGGVEILEPDDSRDLPPEQRADVAVLALRHETARSDLYKATQAVRETSRYLTDRAVRVAVIQRGPSRLLPRRVLRPLAAEILLQVEAGGVRPPQAARWRRVGRTRALAAIERAGLRVLRVSPA
ncbi:hypothetical protein [Desertivibrio insolitus]|uniref:hypothetical protein n=1 Tax=Herbiconiux sp. SYSU D00978 TaxID=2812562 RepID=UPI001A97A710|nr:hypothetical protein [Herbiconiux sp. SYSU D00978]